MKIWTESEWTDYNHDMGGTKSSLIKSVERQETGR